VSKKTGSTSKSPTPVEKKRKRARGGGVYVLPRRRFFQERGRRRAPGQGVLKILPWPWGRKERRSGGGGRTLPGRFVLLAAVVEGSPGQSRAILVAGRLSGSRNQHRVSQDLRCRSLRFGRQVGHHVVQRGSAGGFSRPCGLSHSMVIYWPGERWATSAAKLFTGGQGQVSLGGCFIRTPLWKDILINF